ncbi:hypothetical protein [Lewinella sp. IMCC34191]|uniref:hypothetical protein n=1 Tax=Lewinella sp. IMCC34191 TaxID=2259172 RepID=UPI000E22F5DB|nr:hypothetical protein [Lewinella sp. IMCC34191]
MLKLLKFIWKDSVESKVIASIILVLGGGALALFWSTITALSSTAIGWFAGKTAVANWLLAAGCVDPHQRILHFADHLDVALAFRRN